MSNFSIFRQLLTDYVSRIYVTDSELFLWYVNKGVSMKVSCKYTLSKPSCNIFQKIQSQWFPIPCQKARKWWGFMQKNIFGYTFVLRGSETYDVKNNTFQICWVPLLKNKSVVNNYVTGRCRVPRVPMILVYVLIHYVPIWFTYNKFLNFWPSLTISHQTWCVFFFYVGTSGGQKMYQVQFQQLFRSSRFADEESKESTCLFEMLVSLLF